MMSKKQKSKQDQSQPSTETVEARFLQTGDEILIPRVRVADVSPHAKDAKLVIVTTDDGWPGQYLADAPVTILARQ